MSLKIGAADNVPRFQPTTRTKSNKTGRRYSFRGTARLLPWQGPHPLTAHGGFGPSNNDEVAEPEVDVDWRSVRAKLVTMEKGGVMGPLSQSWAHEIAHPEKGCLLVCRREGLGFFHQSVVFILSHDATSTLGLVLNHPSPSLLEDAIFRGWEPGRFVSERIYFGGPVEMNTLHILHSHGELEKCTEVIDGVYIGGFEDAQMRVQAGAIPAGDFKVLVGYASWDAGQLEREIEDKCWFVLSSSKDIILQKAQGHSPIHLLFNTCLTAEDHATFNTSLWKRVLELSDLEIPF